MTAFRLLHSERGNAERQAALAAEIETKSIAVLPFENLSEEKANAYFAERLVLTKEPRRDANKRQLEVERADFLAPGERL